MNSKYLYKGHRCKYYFEVHAFLFQQLTDKFRYHYSKLWLAIIARDKEAIKFYSGKLGINDDLYALFACMVAGRPWDVIMNGIDVTKPSAAEVKKYIWF